jgi:hypothetical protein
MDGNHNFIGKAAGVFMNMDNMLGADIDWRDGCIARDAVVGAHAAAPLGVAGENAVIDEQVLCRTGNESDKALQ